MTGKTMVILQGMNDLDELNKAASSAASPITPTPIPQGISTLDNISQLMGLVFLLIIILIAAYFTSKFVGGIKLGQLKNSNFKVIDSYRISQNKVIQIVKIGNKFIVISIGKDTVNFITELEEAEVLIREVRGGEKLNFKQILDKLKNNNE
jgi:flagellar protein FliO/FliZ